MCFLCFTLSVSSRKTTTYFRNSIFSNLSLSKKCLVKTILFLYRFDLFWYTKYKFKLINYRDISYIRTEVPIHLWYEFFYDCKFLYLLIHVYFARYSLSGDSFAMRYLDWRGFFSITKTNRIKIGRANHKKVLISLRKRHEVLD